MKTPIVHTNMATINKKRITTRPVKKICSKTEDSKNYYNTMAWHRLRNQYMSEHPLCEECLSHCHIEEATDVHHIKPFVGLPTEEERWSAFLDHNNLMSLCETCHYAMHTKIKTYNLNTCDELTDKEWRSAHDLTDE